MADPKHPRRFSDDFKRQVVELRNAGKPMSEIMAEHDLGRSTVCRRTTSTNATGSPHARPGEGHRARAREPQAAHGGRRFKASGADIRTKATVTAANAGRCPVSAQRGILGVPRSTCCAMRSRAGAPKAPDPIGPDVLTARARQSRRWLGRAKRSAGAGPAVS